MATDFDSGIHNIVFMIKTKRGILVILSLSLEERELSII